MSLKDLVHGPVVGVAPTASVAEAARLMEERNVGSIVVAGNGQAMGIVTDRDIVLRVVNRGLDPRVTPVAQVMSVHPAALSEDLDLHEALEAMKDTPARRFPIVNGQGEVTGLLALDDVIPLLSQELAAVASVVAQERRRA